MSVYYAPNPDAAVKWIYANASTSRYRRMYAFGEYPYRYMERFAGQSQGSYRCTNADMDEISSAYEDEIADFPTSTFLLVLDYLEPTAFDPRMDYLVIARVESRT